jgi:hypothetical protein
MDDVSLKEYMDEKFRLQAEATKLAADALSTRLEAMNEFRAEIKDYVNTLVTRQACDLKHDGCQDKVNLKLDDLTAFKNQLEGKASQQSVYIAWVLAIVSICISIWLGVTK